MLTDRQTDGQKSMFFLYQIDRQISNVDDKKNYVNLPEDMDAASRAAAAITQAHPASISGLTLEEVRDRKVTISLVSLSKTF